MVHIIVKSKTDSSKNKFIYIIENISDITIGIFRHNILTEEFKEFGNFSPFMSQYGKYIYGKELE